MNVPGYYYIVFPILALRIVYTAYFANNVLTIDEQSGGKNKKINSKTLTRKKHKKYINKKLK
jgi:hypothetical protein